MKHRLLHLFGLEPCKIEWITREDGSRQMWAVCTVCKTPVLYLVTE